MPIIGYVFAMLWKLLLRGYSPEEIAGSVYPELTLAQVYAALAYYEDHRDEINEAGEAEAATAAEFVKSHPDLVCDRRPRDATPG